MRSVLCLVLLMVACGETHKPVEVTTEVTGGGPVVQQPPTPVPTAPAPVPAPVEVKEEPPKTYVVKNGDSLIKIGEEHKVSWQEMLLLNEQLLKDKYDRVCAPKSKSYRNRKKGWYCNDAKDERPYGNTLQAGWELRIPSTVVPKTIDAAVQASVGKRIAIVVDDTGSMLDDRRDVAAFYANASAKYKKDLVGVWLYSEGQVRRYTDAGSVQFLASGGHENTWGALQAAAAAKPDTIILVTDEPGDDWPAQITGIPPVIAHCLPTHGTMDCEHTLRILVKAVGGAYISGVQ